MNSAKERRGNEETHNAVGYGVGGRSFGTPSTRQSPSRTDSSGSMSSLTSHLYVWVKSVHSIDGTPYYFDAIKCLVTEATGWGVRV